MTYRYERYPAKRYSSPSVGHLWWCENIIAFFLRKVNSFVPYLRKNSRKNKKCPPDGGHLLKNHIQQIDAAIDIVLSLVDIDDILSQTLQRGSKTGDVSDPLIPACFL